MLRRLEAKHTIIKGKPVMVGRLEVKHTIVKGKCRLCWVD